MEPLQDPYEDRVVKDFPPPPAEVMSDEILFPKGDGVPDWETLKDHFVREGKISKE